MSMVTVVALVSIGAACGTLDLRAPIAAGTKPAPSTWSSEELNVAYLGHASVLMGLGPTRILTDPVLYDRIGMQLAGATIGPKRRVAAVLTAEEMLPLSAVLVSHAHMDSLDRASLARLAKDVPTIVVPARTRDLVHDLGFRHVVELGWGQRTNVGVVRIEAVEVSHWGRRWPWDAWRGYNGYVLEAAGISMLFASDTAYTELVGRVARERGVEIMILGNGAYEPWIQNHASPEQVWQMFKESGARQLVPVHWDTFALGREPVGEAIARLVAAAGSEAHAVAIRAIGGTWTRSLVAAAQNPGGLMGRAETRGEP